MDLSTGDPAGARAAGPPPPGPPAPPSLPPPPPPVPYPAALDDLEPRYTLQPSEAGQLTTGWRVATALVWALTFVALIAVWKTSRELGLNTWWLGPLGNPAPWFVTLVPFVPSAAMVLLVLNNFKYVPWAGFVAAAWLAIVGAFDFDKVPRLAIVELAVAAAGALTSAAGFAGRYRDSGR